MTEATRDNIQTQDLKKTNCGLSVVVPVYNSAEILPSLLNRLIPVLQQTGLPHEIILVNDCSPDNSWEIIENAAAQNKIIRGVNLMKNFSQHNALFCGIRTAAYDTIITMDDDLQHPPESVLLLIAKLNDGFDVVYGSPDTEQHGILRNIASRITKVVLQKSMGIDVARKISALRAFRSSLRSAFDHHRGPHVALDVMLTWGTKRFASIPVKHEARKHGKSNYTIEKLITHAFNMITGFSVIPLQIASMIGFTLTIFGFVVLVYVLGRYLLEGTTAPGFPFLAAIISIFSGAQLCAIGIIGEYLSRMHFRLMNCPPYTIRSTVNCDDITVPE